MADLWALMQVEFAPEVLLRSNPVLVVSVRSKKFAVALRTGSQRRNLANMHQYMNDRSGMTESSVACADLRGKAGWCRLRLVSKSTI